jgi:hypothetical protein
VQFAGTISCPDGYRFEALVESTVAGSVAAYLKTGTQTPDLCISAILDYDLSANWMKLQWKDGETQTRPILPAMDRVSVEDSKK